MRKTKNDLSFNHVKLDHESLFRSCAIAMRETRQNMIRELDEMRSKWEQSIVYKKSDSMLLKTNAGFVSRYADELQMIAETLDALHGIKVRNNIEWVNLERDENNLHEREDQS